VTSLPDPRASYVMRTVSNVPPALKSELVADARLRDISIADVALEILGDYFQIPVYLRAHRFKGGGSSRQLTFQHPREMSLAVWTVAQRLHTTESGAILYVLAQHYGLEFEAPRIGRPRGVRS
jgi:hypothetical protein